MIPKKLFQFYGRVKTPVYLHDIVFGFDFFRNISMGPSLFPRVEINAKWWEKVREMSYFLCLDLMEFHVQWTPPIVDTVIVDSPKRPNIYTLK